MSIKRCTKPIMWKENLRRITEQSEPLENQINIPWFILNPEGRTVRYWSRFMSLLLIYTAIITPYRIGFIQQDDLTWSIAEYLVSLLFFIDLVMNCILPYYDKDKTLITAPKPIQLVSPRSPGMSSLFSLFQCKQAVQLNDQSDATASAVPPHQNNKATSHGKGNEKHQHSNQAGEDHSKDDHSVRNTVLVPVYLFFANPPRSLHVGLHRDSRHHLDELGACGQLRRI